MLLSRTGSFLSFQNVYNKQIFTSFLVASVRLYSSPVKNETHCRLSEHRLDEYFLLPVFALCAPISHNFISITLHHVIGSVWITLRS